MSGRLTTLQAAYVIARRDFMAILMSRSFIFFLLGPIFPVLVGAMAGGIGAKVQQSAERPVLGVAMAAADADAMIGARDALSPRLGDGLPKFIAVERVKPGEAVDADALLAEKRSNIAAVLSGTPQAPVLTGTSGVITAWQGPVSLIAAHALGEEPESYPRITLTATASSVVQQHHGQVSTAQAGQMLLFLLTMLLAGMVLSNLVEEKGNKIIEILAAAIPMDAVFLGKLFAMLAVSFVGIAVWGSVGGIAMLAAGNASTSMAAPAVGWPLFVALGVAYFAMAYLLIGALFLTIGSMAATVREVQTLSMPVTFLQLLFFFLASYAVADPGSTAEKVAMVVPFSSPYTMLAHAALDGAVWPHVAALAWQGLCVGLIIRIGAQLFRSRVMKSGPARVKSGKRGLFARRAPAQA